MFANNTKSGAGNVTQGEVEKESYPFVGGWGGGGEQVLHGKQWLFQMATDACFCF